MKRGITAPESRRSRLTLPGIATAVLLASLVWQSACTPRSETPPPPREERAEMKTGKSEPQETKGAPYPAAKPSDRIPNPDPKPQPVPIGPKVGDMKPLNAAVRIEKIEVEKDPRRQQKQGSDDGEGFVELGGGAFPQGPRPLYFRDYLELDNTIGSTSLCCPEVSVAENGQTIMMTGNVWMALSEDGGASFANINPTTIFPQSDGGLCCDQVIVYVPRIDMFVWLMQYWNGTNGKNRIRIAAQTTAEVRASNGTAWTYWDFVSDTFDINSTLDYNDVAVGDTSFWWTSQNGTGRVVVRFPLSELAAKGTINFQFTAGTDALWSHLTQNATNTVYWAGHVSNSELRVYSMRDGDGFYSWRSVSVNSWPNGTNSSQCPDGTDWLTFESWKHYVFGNALQGNTVWFGWLAAAGGGFPQPHVQMVRINPGNWTLQEQVQIWNPTIAFIDAYLSTNSKGELGMEIAFGSGGFYPSSAAGVWGDFVVYYPRLSTRCVNRWGNYNHSRRAGSNSAEWVSAGYTNEKNASGNDIARPHYIRFGR